MLEQLEALVKEATGAAVNNAPDVPNDQAGAIAQHAQSSILSELQSAVSGGGLSSIIGMFGGQSGDVANHAVTQNILGNLTNSLASKFGLSPETAANLSNSIVPNVLSSLSSKFSNPNDNNVTEGSLTSLLSGGGLMDKLKSLL